MYPVRMDVDIRAVSPASTSITVVTYQPIVHSFLGDHMVPHADQ